ncbi:hypothetical protein BaRGS_00023410 [Batillaria attramentaria]|uniref:EF-hand domain-containing protein n=1 Tax=Batillaria attramentaria TaxID=370345 RepID=A0ABD0KDX3_9CAEN
MGQTATKQQKLSNEQVKELRRHVSFSEEEIRDWWKEFTQSTRRTSAGELFLSEDEFVKVYNSVFPGKCDDFARHVFRTFDRNNDSRVVFREFLIGLSISGSMDTEKKLQWAFQVYDVEQRGYITRAGMTEIIRAVFRMIGPMKPADITQSPEEMADEFFRELDRNGDDVISWQEFRDGADRYPMVLNMLQCGPPDEADENDVFASDN